MLARAMVLWIVGLFSLVPYGTYHLLFHASSDQYAALITLVLFWVFGYWGVVGPILGALKVRTVFRAIERTRSKDDLVRALQSADAKEVAIDLIASENHIPRFLAARVYQLLVTHLAARAGPRGAADLERPGPNSPS